MEYGETRFEAFEEESGMRVRGESLLSFRLFRFLPQLSSALRLRRRKVVLYTRVGGVSPEGNEDEYTHKNLRRIAERSI